PPDDGALRGRTRHPGDLPGAALGEAPAGPSVHPLVPQPRVGPALEPVPRGAVRVPPPAPAALRHWLPRPRRGARAKRPRRRTRSTNNSRREEGSIGPPSAPLGAAKRLPDPLQGLR